MDTTDLDKSSFSGMSRERPDRGGSKSQCGNWGKQVLERSSPIERSMKVHR